MLHQAVAIVAPGDFVAHRLRLYATTVISISFAIPPSRLSDIETKGVIPSIFRLYSFAAIYRREYRELLSFYGLELDSISADIQFGRPQQCT